MEQHFLKYAVNALYRTNFRSSREKFESWLNTGTLTKVDVGEMVPIPTNHEHVMFVIYGCLMLSADDFEDDFGIPVFRSMCLFGYTYDRNRETFGGSRYCAITPTWLWKLDRNSYESGLDDPELCRDIMQLRVNELAHTRATCVLYAQYSMKVKLARMIVLVAQLAGVRHNEIPQIHIKHADLALIAGARRSYVSNTLAELVKDGILQTDYGKILILNESKLINMAKFSNYPDRIPINSEGAEIMEVDVKMQSESLNKDRLN